MKVVRGRSEGASENRRGTTFTGDVYADPVLPTTDGVTINTVTFTPGARTYWHSHEGGQILQIIAGRGFVCSEGGPAVEVRAGDTVWVPAGERHWHGGSPESLLAHTAISLGTTAWEGELAESEYLDATTSRTE